MQEVQEHHIREALEVEELGQVVQEHHHIMEEMLHQEIFQDMVEVPEEALETQQVLMQEEEQEHKMEQEAY